MTTLHRRILFSALAASIVAAPGVAQDVASGRLAAPQPAKGGVCPTQVLGDHDGDGDCDAADQALFWDCWIAGDPCADWNFDCIVDGQDAFRFNEFVGKSSTWLDWNLDGVVNIIDYGDFVGDWLDEFQGVVPTTHTNITNLTNGDCVVNFLDLQLFVAAFNSCPWG